MAKIVISITCAKDNPDKATVAMVVANTALVSSQEVIVLLSTEGVRLAVKGYADDIREEGFAPMKKMPRQLHRERRNRLGLHPLFQETQPAGRQSCPEREAGRRGDARRSLVAGSRDLCH